MMAAQPQPPQQPIFPNEFNFALDRIYAKLTGYVDGQVEKVIVQVRIYNQESIFRDNDAVRRDQDLANAMLAITQKINEMDQRLTNMDQRLTTLEKQNETMLQLVKDNHAEAMEAINELRRKDKE